LPAFSAQQLPAALDNCYLAAKAPDYLAEFQANVAAAQHQ
jgi:hypothetical protein